MNEDLVQYMKESDSQYDVRPHLRSITVPTLVLQGRYDWQFSMRAAGELAQNIPHARFMSLSRPLIAFTRMLLKN